MSIEVKNLYFRYRAREVLKEITFCANAGDLLCVLGPNGVGKSTLFRCMLGLNQTFDGEILINGKNTKKIKVLELAKYIAYIPQSHHPTFNFSVLSTVLMGLTTHLGRQLSPKQKDEQTAYEALEQLGISHLYHRGYAEISGGERQLVLIARALVQKAPILVMDEPTANLDYGNQIRVMEKVQALTKSGYTIILSTHNPEHAFVYGNQMLMIYKGGVLERGNPKEKLTKSLIEKVYGVKVGLHDIFNGEEHVRIIVPSKKSEGLSSVFLDERKYSAV